MDVSTLPSKVSYSDYVTLKLV